MTLASLQRTFLMGLVVMVPIWGTVLILTTMFTTLDRALGNLLGPGVASSVPGLGVLALLLIILAAGVLVSNLMGARLWQSAETAILRLPVVRSIYTTLKSLADIVSFMDRGRDNRVVLLPFPRPGLYALGLLMGDAPAMLQLAPEGRLSLIFIPTAPHPFTGCLAFVLTHELIPLRMGFHEAMKMEFSAGLYIPQPAPVSQTSTN